MSDGMRIKFRITYELSPEMMKRKFDKIREQALASLGKWWFQERLPQHFTAQGTSEYGYATRDRRYRVKRKILERLGGAADIELMGITNRKKGKQRGTLKREMLRSGLIRATKNKVTVRMQAPSYVNMRGKSGRSPDKVKELTTISQAEDRKMPALLLKWVTRMINDSKDRQVKRFE